MEVNQNSAGRRVQRVERAVREAIAGYLISGYKGPLRGLVTVSRIQMTGDLQTAKVFVSVLGSSEDQMRTMEGLGDNAFEIQRFIGRQLKLRYCPKLAILEDKSQEVLFFKEFNGRSSSDR